MAIVSSRWICARGVLQVLPGLKREGFEAGLQMVERMVGLTRYQGGGRTNPDASAGDKTPRQIWISLQLRSRRNGLSS